MGLTVLPVNTVSLVSSLPTSPFDGQEIAYLADAAAGVVWHLKYRAASASAYKWEFMGGQSLRSFVAAAATTQIPAVTRTVLQTVTAPLQGDYDVEARCMLRAAATVTVSYLAIQRSGGLEVEWTSDSTLLEFAAAKYPLLSVPAAAAIQLCVRVDVLHAAAVYGARSLYVTPVRVG